MASLGVVSRVVQALFVETDERGPAERLTPVVRRPAVGGAARCPGAEPELIASDHACLEPRRDNVLGRAALGAPRRPRPVARFCQQRLHAQAQKGGPTRRVHGRILPLVVSFREAVGAADDASAALGLLRGPAVAGEAGA
ncbi:hypothetical protein GCM10010260_36560 [Streptomyces filipinensis]|uniref:Uncharacterized protein n=1 Tax=Streptomyces filipinensis TaxID=66887 RepID=A0A918MBW5_9ACTN|nr:hypothetical protein GCM10010260_36560 [Streptomyces filipinensis]